MDMYKARMATSLATDNFFQGAKILEAEIIPVLYVYSNSKLEQTLGPNQEVVTTTRYSVVVGYGQIHNGQFKERCSVYLTPPPTDDKGDKIPLEDILEIEATAFSALRPYLHLRYGPQDNPIIAQEGTKTSQPYDFSKTQFV